MYILCPRWILLSILITYFVSVFLKLGKAHHIYLANCLTFIILFYLEHLILVTTWSAKARMKTRWLGLALLASERKPKTVLLKWDRSLSFCLLTVLIHDLD